MAGSTIAFSPSTILPVSEAPTEPPVPPHSVERGVVAFDLDGTILDDLGLISLVAGQLLEEAFGTPKDEARIHYLATTGMPFEAQLAQLYPDAPAELRQQVARTFHERKVKEAYSHASPFPDVPRVLRDLSRERWTLVVSTGAERETAEVLLEREGLRFWFESILGSGQGTKREHLGEYQRRYPGATIFLVGDSRFDLEAASEVGGVIPIARASKMAGWTITPDDLRRWGAAWADYTLSGLPSVLAELTSGTRKSPPARRAQARAKRPSGSRRAGGAPRRVRKR